MNMNIVGYIFTMLNVEMIGGPTKQVKDISIKIEKTPILKVALNKCVTDYGFKVDDFRTKGYVRQENTGLFLSKNMREYLFRGGYNSDEDGVLILILFEPRDKTKVVSPGNLHYIVPKGHTDDEEMKDLLHHLNAMHS